MTPDPRTILITGAAQGIGRCCANHFIQRGWNVVAVDSDAEAGADLLGEYGCERLRFVHGDVADETTAPKSVARALESFGSLHALLNNAAIAQASHGSLDDLPLAQWNRVIGVNLTGAFLMAQHAAPALRATKGSIINVASTRALQSEPHCEAYAASKGGLLALTHALAASLSGAVRVNCISPGWIETCAWRTRSQQKVPQHSEADQAQHWAGRVGRPEDIAALVDFLVSDAAGFITGQKLDVDGGYGV